MLLASSAASYGLGRARPDDTLAGQGHWVLYAGWLRGGVVFGVTVVHVTGVGGGGVPAWVTAIISVAGALGGAVAGAFLATRGQRSNEELAFVRSLRIERYQAFYDALWEYTQFIDIDIETMLDNDDDVGIRGCWDESLKLRKDVWGSYNHLAIVGDTRPVQDGVTVLYDSEKWIAIALPISRGTMQTRAALDGRREAVRAWINLSAHLLVVLRESAGAPLRESPPALELPVLVGLEEETKKPLASLISRRTFRLDGIPSVAGETFRWPDDLVWAGIQMRHPSIRFPVGAFLALPQDGPWMLGIRNDVTESRYLQLLGETLTFIAHGSRGGGAGGHGLWWTDTVFGTVWAWPEFPAQP